MPRTHDDEEDWDTDDDACDIADHPNWDTAHEDEATTQPCPHCRKGIYEDAVRCPYCENYISRVDNPAGGRSKWFYILAMVCLAIAVGWALKWW